MAKKRKSLPYLTNKEREKILEKYEITPEDIRLLERKGINASREIAREIQSEYPNYEFNGLDVYSVCYKEWKSKKAPVASDAKN